jgi:hypothetical protein
MLTKTKGSWSKPPKGMIKLKVDDLMMWIKENEACVLLPDEW